jgi:hypothetical protein
MEHEPIRLDKAEWFNIAGRGKVAVVDMADFPPGRKLNVGDTLYIENTLYICRGIETGHGTKRGLLVKEAK